MASFTPDASRLTSKPCVQTSPLGAGGVAGPVDGYTPLILRNLDKKHLQSVVCSVSFGSDILREKDAVRKGKVTGHGSEVDDYLKQNHLSI